MKEAILAHWKQRWVQRKGRTSPFAGPAHLQVGFETRAIAHKYQWDGLRRGGDPRQPFAVVQATLAGAGRLATPTAQWTVGPGQAFVAIVPSAHSYGLPEGAPPWTFFWCITRHPYVVERLRDLVERTGPVFALPEASAAGQALRELWQGTVEARWSHSSAQEAALFAWYFAHEAHLLEPPATTDRRAQLLRVVQQAAATAPGGRVPVRELAEACGLSRSNFSHAFRAATGQTPAAALRQARLAEAARRLVERRDSLKQVALELGFANANHFGKCFACAYGVSPGRYQRLAG